MKLRLAVVAAAVAVLVVTSLAATGSASHSGSRTLRFREASKGETFRFIDHAPRAKLKRGFPVRISIGDEIVFGETLLNAARRRAGRLEGFCKALTGSKDFERVRFGCVVFARLKGGTLSLAAAITFAEGKITGQVTGGSGAYEGANGSFTSSGENNALDVFHIVTF
jgi:hypothetical protein